MTSAADLLSLQADTDSALQAFCFAQSAWAELRIWVSPAFTYARAWVTLPSAQQETVHG